MDDILTWKIKEFIFEKDLFSEINEMNNKTYLLDLNKNKYSILEKYVYDIACFHIKRLFFEGSIQIDINDFKNDYFIEFWCKTKYTTSSLHVDCDENLRKEKLDYNYPLLSCITYLNDNNLLCLEAGKITE
jgi:hypothetical protein